MSIANKLAKPVTEIIEHIAQTVPKALGHGHHRLAEHVHQAADRFDKVESDIADKAKGHHHGGSTHHDPHTNADTGASAAAQAGAGHSGTAASTAVKDAEKSARDGGLRSHDGGDPSIPGHHRHCLSDPVDTATGEMLLSVMDVHLPGAMPLVLERTHLSSYRHGVRFGPTWASTLDQRLQLDSEGVVFAAADGMRLAFPPPRPGVAVLPHRGPQLGLTWSGVPGDPIHVQDPSDGRVLIFHDPRPAAGLQGAVTLRLTAVEDRNGRRIDIRWDDDAPALITHHGGYRIAVERHPTLPRITGFRLLDTEGPGTSTPLARYGYDDRGDLVEVTDSSGTPALFRYDDRHRITGWTDRNGTEYAYDYDDAGRVVRTRGSDGILSNSFAYDDATRTTVFTDSLGRSSVYAFNDAYRLVRSTDATGAETVQEWDADGRLRTAVTDPIGRTSRFAYDDADNFTAIEYPDGSRATFHHDGRGRPVRMTDPAGRTWRAEYDERGNLLASTDPAGARTAYGYDEAGNLVSVTDALGARQEITTDAAGLPVAVTDAAGRGTTARRDAFGRIVESTDALGATVRFGFSVEGRLLWCERSDGRREQWTYDLEGNALTHTDAAGRTTTETTGHFGLTTGATDAEGTAYSFVHDTEQQLVAVINPAGQTWRYEYDAAGRLVTETDFAGRTLTYAYDAAGQLTARTNGAGEAVTFARDVLGRLVEQTDADGTTAYHYDAAGNLERASSTHTEVVLEHDVLGRVVAETVNGSRMAWSYDLLGRTTQRRTPSGIVSTWSYDTAGLPAALALGGHRTEFGRDELGREVSRTLGGHVGLTQTWDATGRLTSQTLMSGPAGRGRTPQERTYSYRSDDFLTEIRESTTGTRQFDLDPTGRITAVRARGWSEEYAYDALGNLSRASTPLDRAGDDAEWDYADGRLRRAGRTAYAYDGQGRTVRTTRRLLNGQRQVRTYSWNARDQLVATVTPDGTRWRYLYDPAGRRIGKQRLAEDGAVAEEIRFIWSGTQLAEQSTSGGHTTTWEYMPGGYRPLAQLDRISAREGAAVRFHTVVTDPVGTPTELLTPEGEVAWQQRTTVWGVPATDPADDTVDCPLRFPGQYADPETGWHFNYFRHYDPHTARYVTPDPLGLDPAPNPEAYVSNPFAWIDPLGLEPAYRDLPGWKNGEPIDTTWGGNVTYKPLDPLNRPGAMTAEIHRHMLGQKTGPKIDENSLPGWDSTVNMNRGHLLAASLGGSNTIPENFVAMHRVTNSPIMSYYEDQVAKAVRNGHVVTYTVTPVYRNAHDLAPVGLTIHASSPQGFAFSPHSSDAKERRAWRKNPNVNSITILNTCY